MLQMIKSILFGKWADKNTPFSKRFFYRLKALVCALAMSEPPGLYSPYGYDHVVITYTDGGWGWGEYGTNYWFESIIVGRGIFRNWWSTYNQGSSD